MKSNTETRKIGFFERYLTIWVLLCIVAGIAVGKLGGESIQKLSNWSWSTINIPVAILVWLMIYPMMVQIDFSSLKKVKSNVKGVGLTLAVNWLIKPLSMAIFAYLFFHYVFASYIQPETATEYLAGAILLGAAPCTAMVFVWSYLTRGNANYTLVQVALNDLILLIAFVPIVGGLFSLFGIGLNNGGATEITVPYKTLTIAVTVFVIIPLATGYVSNVLLRKIKGDAWFQHTFLKRLKPFSILALLLTLVLIFAFQGEVIIENPLSILLIAVPLTLQTYFIFIISWFTGKKLNLIQEINGPSAMIGASNFFELAVAVAIALFGINSGATLTTVVGVLIEVPVMLSLVAFVNKQQHKKTRQAIA